ncbi:MAG: radical SAM protein [Leptolinea sp.]|nr:radical SAM protein [Leptolinea sp.]
MISDEIVLSNTESVCPVCLKRIKAERVQKGDVIYLRKTCPEHGHFINPIWRGNLDRITNAPLRIPAFPEKALTEVKDGCPFDCGLCPEHRQRPCCVLLEVTQRCDLMCPFCYASAGGQANTNDYLDPELEQIKSWYRLLLDNGGPYNIQLSGGEPCVRDDLPEIITIGKEMGFTYFQVNTNGRRISRDIGFLTRLKDAGLTTIYLQFDGVTDEIYREMRGADLLAEKKQAIRNCKELNIGCVLVPTIKPGVNDCQIGEIIKFALQNHPVVRGVHFQPVSYFGRFPQPPVETDRITLPEIISAVCSQTGGMVDQAAFKPSGGPNRWCSFNGVFVVLEDGSLRAFVKKELPCSCTVQDANTERLRLQSFVARNWAAPARDNTQTNNDERPSLGGWDSFLARTKTHLFAITGMAFQDAWTLDLERVQDCCIMVLSPDNRMIPFCAYNLTSQSGRSLYRKLPGQE